MRRNEWQSSVGQATVERESKEGDDASRRWTISRGNVDPFVLIVLIVLQASADAEEMEEG